MSKSCHEMKRVAENNWLRWQVGYAECKWRILQGVNQLEQIEDACPRSERNSIYTSDMFEQIYKNAYSTNGWLL